jgi:sugar phosphate isomerase/epimerase
MALRFGLTSLNLQTAVDRIVVNGVPDFSRFDVVDIVREGVEAGFGIAEVTMDVRYMVPDSLSPDVIERLVSLKDELGHSYTVHLPLWSLELATFDENVRKGSVQSHIESIKIAEPLEPEAYVLHTTGDLAADFSSRPMSPTTLKLISTMLAAYSAQSVEEIIAATEIDPKDLAIENIEFPFDVTSDIVEEYGTGICFDTAHLITRMSGTESIMEFYEKHRSRITEVHLQDGLYEEHDSAVMRDDHVPLGTGVMGDSALNKFLTALLNDRFDGPVIFELSKQEALDSVEKIRSITPAALPS